MTWIPSSNPPTWPPPPDEGDHDGFVWHWDERIDQESAAESYDGDR